MKDFVRKLLGQKFINYYHLAQAVLANLFYGFASRRLHVIGVTGTDGKTTTVNLIARVLQEAKLPTSFVSSINAQIGQTQYDTGLHTTTPSPFLLQRLLRKMVREGSQFAVLEVTSHALDQYRTWGINFETAVITNVTAEHLDYHRTYDEYIKAKAQLFKKVRTAVLNREDGSFEYLSPSPQGRGEKKFLPLEGGGKVGVRAISYGLTPNAEIWADQIQESLTGTKFTAHMLVGNFPIELNLPGRFNISNALAAICVGTAYGASAEVMAKALESITQVSGRMEFLEEGQNFTAVVDFAHTPNALKNLLSFLKSQIAGRLIVVFGSAGERDRNKRPKMGEAADKYADLIVITREDNRSERVEKICEEIVSGIKDKKLNQGYFIIPDRREAIKFALKQAKKDDLVVATGKGHEQSLNIDGQELPWDDRQVMREELTRLVSESSRTSEARSGIYNHESRPGFPLSRE